MLFFREGIEPALPFGTKCQIVELDLDGNVDE